MNLFSFGTEVLRNTKHSYTTATGGLKLKREAENPTNTERTLHVNKACKLLTSLTAQKGGQAKNSSSVSNTTTVKLPTKQRKNKNFKLN